MAEQKKYEVRYCVADEYGVIYGEGTHLATDNLQEAQQCFDELKSIEYVGFLPTDCWERVSLCKCSIKDGHWYGETLDSFYY